MKRLLLVAGIWACAGAALAQPVHHGMNAQAMEDHRMTFSMVRAEVDQGRADGADVLSWDAEAWVGGDVNKLWVASEGERADGETEHAEVQALYSRNVSTFWDLQAGLRHDVEPDDATYLVLGVKGLAPYQFETDAHLFLGEDGDLGARLKQSLDLRFTQRLILEPQMTLEAQAQDVPERGLGAGLTSVEASLALRYEITRKFAPYVKLAYGRKLGETAGLARAVGDDPEVSAVSAGLRVWF